MKRTLSFSLLWSTETHRGCPAIWNTRHGVWLLDFWSSLVGRKVVLFVLKQSADRPVAILQRRRSLHENKRHMIKRQQDLAACGTCSLLPTRKCPTELTWSRAVSFRMSIPLDGSGKKVRKGSRFVESSSCFLRSRFFVPRQGSERDLAKRLPSNWFLTQVVIVVLGRCCSL